MSNVAPALALLVPVSSLIAAFSLLVMTASSYGAKQALGIRIVLWLVSFSFAAAATQHLITFILTPTAPESNPAATLIAWTTITIRFVITLAVWTILYRHYQKQFKRTGISAFWADLAIKSSRPLRQESQEKAHA